MNERIIDVQVFLRNDLADSSDVSVKFSGADLSLYDFLCISFALKEYIVDVLGVSNLDYYDLLDKMEKDNDYELVDYSFLNYLIDKENLKNEIE